MHRKESQQSQRTPYLLLGCPQDVRTLALSRTMVLLILHILISHPFHKFLLQFLFAGQVELVFAGVNVRVFGKGDLDQGGVLLFAEHDADGVVFRFCSDEAVKVVDVHLHLAEILMGKFADLEVFCGAASYVAFS